MLVWFHLWLEELSSGLFVSVLLSHTHPHVPINARVSKGLCEQFLFLCSAKVHTILSIVDYTQDFKLMSIIPNRELERSRLQTRKHTQTKPRHGVTSFSGNAGRNVMFI